MEQVRRLFQDEAQPGDADVPQYEILRQQTPYDFHAKGPGRDPGKKKNDAEKTIPSL